MKESYWGVMVLTFGILAIAIVYFFQTFTNINEHNYTLLKETTEAAMIDALDLASYRKSGIVRIDQEKFVENFIRRFANNAQLSKDYLIEIYDVNEEPPKVSIKISSTADTNITGKIMEFSIENKLDAILEEPHSKPFETGSKPADPIVDDTSAITIGEEGVTDIWDTSDDSYLTAEKCDLSVSFDNSIIHVNKPATSSNIKTSYCGELSCFTYPIDVASCSVTNNTLVVTGKKAGDVTVFLKGNGTNIGGKSFKPNTISVPLTVRNVANSSIALKSKSSTVSDSSIVTVGYHSSNCSSVTCSSPTLSSGCSVNEANKTISIITSNLGAKRHSYVVTCNGSYDARTQTDYLSSSDKFELDRYIVKSSNVSVPNASIVTNNSGVITVQPNISHCGKLSCNNGCTASGDTLSITPQTYGEKTITVSCSGEYDGYYYYQPSSTTIDLTYNEVKNSSVKYDLRKSYIIGKDTFQVGLSNHGCIPKSCGDGCTIGMVSSSYVANITQTTNGPKTYTVSCEGYKTGFVEYQDSSDTFILTRYGTADSSVKVSDSAGGKTSTVTTKDIVTVNITPKNCTVSNCENARTCTNSALTIKPDAPYGDKIITVKCTGITDSINYIKYNDSSDIYTLTYHGKDKSKIVLSEYSKTLLSDNPSYKITATTSNCGTLTCSKCSSVKKISNDGKYELVVVPDKVGNDNKIGTSKIDMSCSGTTSNNIEYEGVGTSFNLTYSPSSTITLSESEKTVESDSNVNITATTTNCGTLTCPNCEGVKDEGNGKYTLTIKPVANESKTVTATCPGRKVGDGQYKQSSASFVLKYNAYKCPDSNIKPVYEEGKGWICKKNAQFWYTSTYSCSPCIKPSILNVCDEYVKKQTNATEIATCKSGCTLAAGVYLIQCGYYDCDKAAPQVKEKCKSSAETCKNNKIKACENDCPEPKYETTWECAVDYRQVENGCSEYSTCNGADVYTCGNNWSYYSGPSPYTSSTVCYIQATK